MVNSRATARHGRSVIAGMKNTTFVVHQAPLMTSMPAPGGQTAARKSAQTLPASLAGEGSRTDARVAAPGFSRQSSEIRRPEDTAGIPDVKWKAKASSNGEPNRIPEEARLAQHNGKRTRAVAQYAKAGGLQKVCRKRSTEAGEGAEKDGAEVMAVAPEASGRMPAGAGRVNAMWVW